MVIIRREDQPPVLQGRYDTGDGAPRPEGELLAPVLDGVVDPPVSFHLMLAAVNPVVELL